MFCLLDVIAINSSIIKETKLCFGLLDFIATGINCD